MSFNHQRVLQIRSGDVNPLYYSRKPFTYNLTVYEGAPPSNAYWYTWTEVNRQTGSCEIGTCLWRSFKTLKSAVSHFVLYSDTCIGQNRNQQIAVLLFFVVNNFPNLQRIEHKYLEKGHSHMECLYNERLAQRIENGSVEKYEEWSIFCGITPVSWFKRPKKTICINI